LTDAQKIELALGIARGMKFLHDNNIIHRDLAARNILLSSDGTPMICDFGMARLLEKTGAYGKTVQSFGPYKWMSPESIDRKYSVYTDVWSYGVVIWEMVARKLPHTKWDGKAIDLMEKIKKEGYTETIPEDCPPILNSLMTMCWHYEPKDRPLFPQIITFINENANVEPKQHNYSSFHPEPDKEENVEVPSRQNNTVGVRKPEQLRDLKRGISDFL